MKEMTQADKKQLFKAYDVLENPGFRIQMMNIIGKPLEKGMELLPDGLSKQIAKVSNVALTNAARLALRTLSKSPKNASYNWSHRLCVWTTGAVGGFFGVCGGLVEIPISTTIMLRSILDIARSEGEDLSSPEACIAALQVFAFAPPGRFHITSVYCPRALP